METSDEALCRRVAERDERAFEELVSRYQERAYRIAWSILRDADEARDLSQEAFIRLYQRAASFGGRARFSTWFFRVLVNLCLDHRRKGRGWRRFFSAATRSGEDEHGSVLDRQAAPFQDPVDKLGRDEMRAQLWAAVAELSPQQRAAVILHVQEDLPTAEVATVLACSEATVRVHLHRALTALRATVGRR